MGMTDEECMQYVIGGEWNLDTKDGLKFVYEVANAGGVDILKAMLEKTSDAASSTVRVPRDFATEQRADSTACAAGRTNGVIWGCSERSGRVH